MFFFDISFNHLVTNTVPKLKDFPRPFLRVMLHFLSPTAYDVLVNGCNVRLRQTTDITYLLYTHKRIKMLSFDIKITDFRLTLT